MSEDLGNIRRRVLEPDERIAELLFGLIMALTFTGSLSVADAGRDDVRTMLIGAIGCNLAWGIIDASFYLMGCLAQRGQGLRTFRAVQNAAVPETAHRIIADALPGPVASVLEPTDLESIRKKLIKLHVPRNAVGIRKHDLLAALGILLLVFVATFPVAVPFLFMQGVAPAARASNAVAILMLFLLGRAYGRCVGRDPWIVGVIMVIFGAILVGMTIALGG